VDVDGSGSVEFPEFCVMMVKKMRESDIENEVNFLNTDLRWKSQRIEIPWLCFRFSIDF
jgi:hypothetical protein